MNVSPPSPPAATGSAVILCVERDPFVRDLETYFLTEAGFEVTFADDGIFMSGYTDDEMVRRGLIEPDHPFLSKPFTPEVLGSKVRQLIDQAVGRKKAH